MTSRLLSGIQPTGVLHLGNYLGAIRHWTQLINRGSEAFIFIADLHAMTVPQKFETLHDRVILTAATYIACGLSPEKCHIFIQSNIAEHTELAWILSCFTATGWMNRMTQFKEKSSKFKEKSSVGLYIYPILQAADILLYKPDYVPVGQDQKQHLELTRDIAESFNRITQKKIFKLPNPLIVKSSARIKSLREGSKKMSKSDDSDYSRINLDDSAEIIQMKLQKAKSDSIEKIYYDEDSRPEISNLINIFATLSNKTIVEIEQEYQNKKISAFKKDLAELIIAVLLPISQKIKNLLQDKSYIIETLTKGNKKAKEIASSTLQEVKDTVGLL